MGIRIGRKVYVTGFKPDGSPAHVMTFCPACNSPHWWSLDGTYENPPGKVQNWTWNGDGNEPTFTPSLHMNADLPVNAKWRCHSVVTKGKVMFCNDSWNMAGKTVDLPDWPEGEEW